MDGTEDDVNRTECHSADCASQYGNASCETDARNKEDDQVKMGPLNGRNGTCSAPLGVSNVHETVDEQQRADRERDGGFTATQHHGHNGTRGDIRPDIPPTIEHSMDESDLSIIPFPGEEYDDAEDNSTRRGVGGNQRKSRLDDSLAMYSSLDSGSVLSSLLTSSLSSIDSVEKAARLASYNAYDSDSCNDDYRAALMGPLMSRHGADIGTALAERVECIESIKWLGHHLPECVVAFLIDEIEAEEAGRGPISEGDYESTNFEYYDHRSFPDGALGGASDIQTNGGGTETAQTHGDRSVNDNSEGYSFGYDENDTDNASMEAPIHYAAKCTPSNDDDEDGGSELPRRHSLVDIPALRSQLASEPTESRRIRRRSSMPLVFRQMHGLSRKERLATYSNYPLPDEEHIQQNDDHQRNRRQSVTSEATPISNAGSYHLVYKDHDLPVSQGNVQLLSGYATGAYEYEPEFQDQVRKDRIIKTRNSMRRLSGNIDLAAFQRERAGYENEADSMGDAENFYFTDAIPPASRHDCALLFVDISGFTKLSTTLKVEPLKKVNECDREENEMVFLFLICVADHQRLLPKNR